MSGDDDTIIRCFICGVLEYQSIMLEGEEADETNKCAGKQCRPMRLCHSKCRVYGITQCQHCDPDSYYEKIDGVLYQIFDYDYHVDYDYDYYEGAD